MTSGFDEARTTATRIAEDGAEAATQAPAAAADRMRLAGRARRMPGSALAELLMLARESGAVDLAVGSPSFPSPPDSFVEGALTALRDGSHQYENPAGALSLRERIAERLPTRPDPVTELTVTVGATEGLSVALQALVEPGSEVVMFEPFYDSFLSAIALAGGTPRVVPLRGPRWEHDPAELAAAFGPRTSVVLLNTPSNPTGRVLSAADLAEIGALCERWDAACVSDEVYAEYVFDGRAHVSVADVPHLGDRSVVVGSLSKSHAVSGWRIGFLRAQPSLTKVLRRVHVALTGGTSAPLQAGAAAGLGALDHSWSPGALMQRKRDRVARAFSRLGFDCLLPEGGCYLMAGFDALGPEPSGQLARRLVEQVGVLMAPGTAFFSDSGLGDRLLRVAFNKSDDTIDEAERRLGALTNARPPRERATAAEARSGDRRV